MTYYVKTGQSTIFKTIKVIENECIISKKVKNIEKIVKKMKKKSIDTIILSKELKNNEQFVKNLNNYDIAILDGKWLMQYLIQDIINCLKENKKKQINDEITILVNDLTNEVRQNIKVFSKTFKKIRIVTNHLEKFKRIEEELYEEDGISIIITNNKRKALTQSKLIINFDFVEELINQYNINENAIIINLSEAIKINKKRFSGSIITDYEVEIEQIEEREEIEEEKIIMDLKDRQEEFVLKEILESKIYEEAMKSTNTNTFNTVRNSIKERKIKIKELYGINGAIA